MPTFNTYQQPASERPLARKWFIVALFASLAIHAGLFLAFRATKLEGFNTTTERLVPRNFSLGRVAVDEKILSDDEEKKPDEQQSPAQAVPNIAVPDDKPSVDTNPQDIVYQPTAPDMAKPIVTDNPKVADTEMKNLNQMQENVSKDLDNDLNKVSEQLIKDKTQTSSKSVLKFSENTKAAPTGSTAPGSDSAIPGTKSLDEALSTTGGGLQNGDKIGIRGGALFEFDSADLRPEAANDLKKLAIAVIQHPKATLIIEGYADSIGANLDPQYNKDLSQKRADAVKDCLVAMGIRESRIQAVGNGSTNFIDPPTFDPAKQALEQNNRRVEIVFSFPH